MKKLTALLLCLCLLLPCFALTSAAANKGFKACVATDIHYSAVDEVPKVDGEYEYYNSLGLMPTLAPRFLDEFLKKAAASDADYVFLCGDITDISDRTQARAAAKVLARFEKKTGKQVFLINGNHDLVYAGKPDKTQLSRAAFRKIYARFGFDEALVKDTATCSYTADLKNGYRLIAIDAVDIPGEGGATITPALADWIKAQAAAAKKDGVQLVAIMHHPLMEHFTLMKTLLPIFVVSNSEEACALVDDCDIRCVFTGHFHQNDVAVYQGKGSVYDIQTTSLSCYPTAFREATFKGKSLKLHTVTIDSISTENLPKGYTAAQKQVMEKDLSAFMYNSVVKDSGATVKGYLNADLVRSKLKLTGIKTPLLNALIDGVAEGFDLPLYGKKGSVEAYAKKLGLTLPKTEYATMNELAGAFIAAQFAGDEAFTTDTPLFRAVLYGALALLARSADRTFGKGGLSKVFALLETASGKASSAPLVSDLAARWNSMFNGKFTRDPMTPLLQQLEPVFVGLTVDKPPADNEVTLQLA